MKYKSILIISLALLISGIQTIVAQDVLTKGYIKMEITDIQSDDENMMAMAGMLKSSFTDIYFSPEKSFTRANMMGGMSETSVLVDHKNNENIMLMSIMGQKMKIDMNQEEFDQMQSGGDADLSKLEYKHHRDQTKEILGFTCHKVDVMLKDGNELDMTFWVTDQIKTQAHVSNGIQTKLLEGFPMEYVISMAGQLDMTMTSTVFEKDFDASVFNLDTTGYKTMTMKEFMDTMGSMGGGF